LLIWHKHEHPACGKLPFIFQQSPRTLSEIFAKSTADNEREAQLSQRDCTMLCAIESFAELLMVLEVI